MTVVATGTLSHHWNCTLNISLQHLTVRLCTGTDFVLTTTLLGFSVLTFDLIKRVSLVLCTQVSSCFHGNSPRWCSYPTHCLQVYSPAAQLLTNDQQQQKKTINPPPPAKAVPSLDRDYVRYSSVPVSCSGRLFSFFWLHSSLWIFHHCLFAADGGEDRWLLVSSTAL